MFTKENCVLCARAPKTDAKSSFFVYLAKCSDGSLYTGYTTDIDRRARAHSLGRGAKYTRGRGPVAIVYYEKHETKSDALKREYALKRMTHAQKLHLAAKS